MLDLGLELNFFESPLAKIGVLILLSFYFIFTLVIVKQVHQMTKTLSVGFEKQMNFIAAVHALVALGVIVLAWAIL